MSTSKTYWIAIPGSTEPPSGPLSLDDILGRVGSGEIPNDATVCEVGQADWVELAVVLPRPRAKPTPILAAPVSIRAVRLAYQRSEIETHYHNLASVGAGTVTYGQLIQGLGWLFGIGGVFAIFALEGFSKLAGAVPVFLGVFVHIAGTMIAAAGEAMNALKDIAVNTRLIADQAGQDHG